MRSKSKKKLNKNNFIMIIICVLLCVLIFFIVQKSLSKYVIEDTDYHAQESTSFYFESDLVDIDTSSYTIDTWDGTEYDVNFYIRNYTDSLQKADEDIEYTISAKIETDENIEVTIIDSLGYEVDSADVLSLGSSSYAQNDYTLQIVPGGTLSAGDTATVTITISSTSPYVKTMTAVITLTVASKMENVTSSLTEAESKEYVTLTLLVNDASEDINITYDTNKLTLDTSSTILNSANTTVTEGSITISNEDLETGQVIEIYFVKPDTSDTISLGTDIIVS